MHEIRYAFRVLLRGKALTAAALICLALGIGVTTAMFSIVNTVVFRPLPYLEPERLVRVYTEFPTFPNGGLRKFWTSPPEFLDLRRETKSWESLEAWNVSGVNLGGAQEPERITTAFVSGGMLPMLGVSPIKGRLLTPADDKPDTGPVAVISYGLWQRMFGGDSNILTRQVKINGRDGTILGVMPDGFQFPPGEIDPPELWTPLQINPANPGGRGSHFLYLLGRVKAGVSVSQARQELDQLTNAYGEKASPNTHLFHPKFHPLVSSPLHDEVVGSVRPAMLALLGAVGFVLLIACGNVANLLLAKAEGRQKEISIRTAMGADNGALLRQFFLEGLLLSLAGAVLGLLAAYGALRLVVRLEAGSIPRAAEIGIDVRVLLVTLGVSVATGIFFGLAPFLHRFSASVSEALKSAGGRTTSSIGANRFRKAMVSFELALALVLLIGAGLMVRTFWKLQAVDSGLRAENVLTMRLAMHRSAYPDNQRLLQFWEQLLGRLNRLPGVEAATMLVGMPPIRPINANDTQIEGFVQREGGPRENIDYYQVIGDRVLEATGARLIEGRVPDERDGAAAPPVVVINQTMARIYWPGESALGKRIRPSFRDPWRTVVGVVADIKNAGVDKPAGTELFLPFRQVADFGLRGGLLFIRTRGEPKNLIPVVRGEIAALDPGLPISQVRTFEEVLGVAHARPRFLGALFTMFSAVALLLAAVGIYGVMSYTVAQRTGEIGVRMAIGAERADVLRMVLGQGMILGVAGVAAGAIGAWALTRFLSGLLFGVETVDPVTFAGMGAALAAVVLVACLFPARRATRVDPMVALRYE